MNTLKKTEQEYYTILNQQEFDKSKLDYTILEKHTPFLNQMAQVKNSGLTVFDLNKKEHVYSSFNLTNLFGYDLNKIDTNYYNSRVHAEDLISLMNVGILVLKKLYELPIKERKDYKLQNEYRILNSQNKYIRIIEQFQVLELDNRGNFWLALSTMDISPHQEDYEGIRSQWIHLESGEINFVEIKKIKAINFLIEKMKFYLLLMMVYLVKKYLKNYLSVYILLIHTGKIF